MTLRFSYVTCTNKVKLIFWYDTLSQGEHPCAFAPCLDSMVQDHVYMSTSRLNWSSRRTRFTAIKIKKCASEYWVRLLYKLCWPFFIDKSSLHAFSNRIFSICSYMATELQLASNNDHQLKMPTLQQETNKYPADTAWKWNFTEKKRCQIFVWYCLWRELYKKVWCRASTEALQMRFLFDDIPQGITGYLHDATLTFFLINNFKAQDIELKNSFWGTHWEGIWIVLYTDLQSSIIKV